MSDWSSHKTEYGYELDIFPSDSEVRLYVEYHDKYDLFTVKLLHYPEHDMGDSSAWNHEETSINLNLSGRNIQVLMGFFKEHCKKENWWLEEAEELDTITAESDELKAQNEKYREAIVWYANKDNYEWIILNHLDPSGIAKEALKDE